MEQKEWLVVNYSLPREPSRVRVSIWRKLKKIGAVNLQQSMWVMPLNDENYDTFSDMGNEIKSNNGEVLIMKSIFLGKGDEEGIIKQFNNARDDEYKEFLDKCDDFFKEIEKETSRENFSFAEIEENEEELRKLNEWYKKIELRDFFSAPLKGNSKLMLTKCEDILNEFCEKVYEFNDKV